MGGVLIRATVEPPPPPPPSFQISQSPSFFKQMSAILAFVGLHTAKLECPHSSNCAGMGWISFARVAFIAFYFAKIKKKKLQPYLIKKYYRIQKTNRDEEGTKKRIEGDTLKPGTSEHGIKIEIRSRSRTLGFATWGHIEPLWALVQFCVF